MGRIERAQLFTITLKLSPHGLWVATSENPVLKGFCAGAMELNECVEQVGAVLKEFLQLRYGWDVTVEEIDLEPVSQPARRWVAIPAQRVREFATA